MGITCCLEWSALERVTAGCGEAGLVSIPMYFRTPLGSGILLVVGVTQGARQRMGEFVSFHFPMKGKATPDVLQKMTRMEDCGAPQKLTAMASMFRTRDSGATAAPSARQQDSRT